MYLLEPVLSDSNEFFQNFQLRMSVNSETWQLSSGSTCAPGGSPKTGENRRSRGFYRSDTEGKTDQTIPSSPNPRLVCMDCRYDYTVMHDGP